MSPQPGSTADTTSTSGTGDTGLQLDRLSVGYQGRRRRWVPLLWDVHAVARRSELTVLLGPNGTGKSTLLRTLSGLSAPLAGTCRLDAVDLAQLGEADRARSLAVVLTERSSPALLTSRELVALGRHPHTGLTGRLSAHDHEQVAWALAAVGATQLAERRVAELSDGERQRVFVARALAQDPAVMLLDEPTAFLDASARVSVISLLRRLARQRDMAVVVCTHDLELALRVADAVWLLSEGSLRSGTPEELTLSGEIGVVFDSSDLVFDPTAGVFRPEPDTGPTPTAHVTGPNPYAAAVGRALTRAGWKVWPEPGQDASPDTAPDTADSGTSHLPLLAVHASAAGYRSTHAGNEREHASLGELTRWAQRLASERS